ncbi:MULTISPECIES: hypothetical protein [Streptomyces]|uniref:Uncharacterized protein n=1 Tax=Streptomyces koyangensis TaxID=188770 RepID=A0A385D4J9_9ACTN|nr:MULTISPECIES: hypothetical protein [Streptomyces]WTD07069.1 hypothetical protein OH717_33125 [Streptomyces albidoflavus]AXQ53266.1 hypothetical protein D0C37_00475 [Streptomyces koyangensis]PKR45683.1 hypothetical protein CWE27_07710 [Streptomyces sp. EAG2]QRF05986.1 hypothetical protein G9U55_30130 [Streptomyces koyangensis]RZF05127.1 hypothetical protein C0L86_00175 [Streptomyces sp. SCA2-2]
MQTDDAATHLTGGTGESAVEHPVGAITLFTAGSLGLRSRLLSASEGGAAYSHELPWTTMTAPQ